MGAKDSSKPLYEVLVDAALDREKLLTSCLEFAPQIYPM